MDLIMNQCTEHTQIVVPSFGLSTRKIRLKVKAYVHLSQLRELEEQRGNEKQLVAYRAYSLRKQTVKQRQKFRKKLLPKLKGKERVLDI